MKEILNKIKYNAGLHLTNFKGWKAPRKIVVFESDDWGSIRMESKKAFNSLKSKGLQVDTSFYNTYDALEQKEDLEELFNVLSQHKDKHGRNAVFTPNMVVANPDFNKIKEADFAEYFYEDFTATYKNVNGNNLMPLWQKGIDQGLVKPQFHAREHVNKALWMKALKSGDKDTLTAFEYNFFGHKVNPGKFGTRTLLAAYDVKDEMVEETGNIIKDGLTIFQDIFGYIASSFIACNYIWPEALEEILSEQGIKYIQTRRIQSAPVNGATYKKIPHYTGQQNLAGQLYTVRNCYFEPSSDRNKDWVEECLFEIGNAFFYKRPAIISSHRLNYIGSLESTNRDNGLRQLDMLLKKITNKWPDVEFFSSGELGDLITTEKK